LDSRSDKELVAGCRRGDREAYAELVRKHSRHVFAVCYAVLGNVHDAEDTAQQALIKGFRKINSISSRNSFGPWISRIAKNMCIDHIRRRKQREVQLTEKHLKIEQTDRQYPDLQEAIRKLPDEYRMPLVLYYLNGQNTTNIAETMELSENAVRARLSRARRKLRQILESIEVSNGKQL